MLGRRMAVRVLAAAVLVSGAGFSSFTLGASDRFTDVPESRGGTFTGILVEKTSEFIRVKEDGKADTQRYVPLATNGVPDPAMLETFKKLIVPNRVKLTWTLQKPPRVVKVEMLLPTAKSGSVIGLVQACETTWIEVKPDGGAPERYMPRWIGGLPAAGGGLDKEMQAALVDFKTGDRVQLDWTYDERKRVVKISKVE